jgi:hypothetical protein
MAEGTAPDPQHGLGDHRNHGRGQAGEDGRDGGAPGAIAEPWRITSVVCEMA